jgi:hypothetical protein
MVWDTEKDLANFMGTRNEACGTSEKIWRWEIMPKELENKVQDEGLEKKLILLKGYKMTWGIKFEVEEEDRRVSGKIWAPLGAILPFLQKVGKRKTIVHYFYISNRNI